MWASILTACVQSNLLLQATLQIKNGSFRNLSLKSGDPMQVWVEYDSMNRQLNVTMSPIHIPKPELPLLSLKKDLSPFLLEYMYVGFSSSTGLLQADHYILGWSFKMNGQAQQIDSSRLPKLPQSRQVRDDKQIKRILAIAIVSASNGQPKGTLNWMQRFKIIKDVASGLLYLHQQWVKVVIHRDIKASNVLIDNEFNGRLGDFGLAKLCDHGTDPQTLNSRGPTLL
ncbi:L-type lectin-domain containing receptor kinase V.9-like [Rhododendron vialii]|uniref:L-type lectin-domain containing receptor kinase V.9-like n=1 Tax=Rhododendron vialii TaxID=182163 RepID=UPI00265E8799|nr:L-type lectin-domain containing receptor kinase V.9-like [Rhododendron vialii]